MNDQMTEPSLGDTAAEILRRRIGLSPLSIGLTAIGHAVARRMRAVGLDDKRRYYRLLKTSPGEADELVEEVVVGETWFFRDRAAFEALAARAAKGGLPAGWREAVSVLSMPCSSGEEPYSAAMALLDAGLKADRVAITAMDVSRRALASAREGIYGPRSFRGDDLSFRERHFQALNGGWRITDALRGLVSFLPGNLLLPPPTVASQRFDTVFMRNLLIYLTPDHQAQAINLVRRLLKPGGLVFVGLAEAGILLRAGLKRQQIPGAAAFSLEKSGPTRPKPHRSAAQTAKAAKAGKAAKPGLEKTLPPLRKRQPEPQMAPVPTSPSPQAEPEGAKALSKARQLADRGRLAEAGRICDELIASGRVEAGVFLLRGMIAEADGRAGQAREWLRKALYLEPEEPEAIYHLALMEERTGNPDRARVLRERLNRLTEVAEASHG